MELFRVLGFEKCSGYELESGFEKVALYTQDGEWTHAARQLESGRWTSKLGMFEDIAHTTLDGLSGNLYGDLHCVMRRPRAG